jgi:hypothetical protein
VKLSKCEFAQQQLEYLRHIISKDGVAIDPKKTKVMREWHVPKATIELRGVFWAHKLPTENLQRSMD